LEVETVVKTKVSSFIIITNFKERKESHTHRMSYEISINPSILQSHFAVGLTPSNRENRSSWKRNWSPSDFRVKKIMHQNSINGQKSRKKWIEIRENLRR